MAVTVRQIREAMAAALETIPETQISAYLMPNPTLPTLMINVDGVSYDNAMQGGEQDWRFKVIGLTQLTAAVQAASIKLDSYIAPTGTSSVKALLEADTTLGGIVDHLHVVSAAEYKEYALHGGVVALGVEWDVMVMADVY